MYLLFFLNDVGSVEHVLARGKRQEPIDCKEMYNPNICGK